MKTLWNHERVCLWPYLDCWIPMSTELAILISRSGIPGISLSVLTNASKGLLEKDLCLTLCLFSTVLASYSRIFHSYVDVTINVKRLQILTCSWQLWSLSSKYFKVESRSLACEANFLPTEPPRRSCLIFKYLTKVPFMLTMQQNQGAFHSEINIFSSFQWSHKFSHTCLLLET